MTLGAQGALGTTVADLSPARPLDLAVAARLRRAAFVGSQHHELMHPARALEGTRPYEPGDRPALIDWRVFARSDALMVRQVRDETSLRVSIQVDRSSTMDFPTNIPDLARVLPSKFEVALRLATCLMASHLHLGDRVHGYVEGLNESGMLRGWSPRRRDLLEAWFEEWLERKDLTGSHALWDVFVAQVDPETTSRRVDVAYMISDALDRSPSHESLANHDAAHRLFIHLLSSAEVDFGWLSPGTTYFDETGVVRERDGRRLRDGQMLAREVERWCTRVAQACQGVGWEYLLVHDRMSMESFERSVQTFLRDCMRSRRWSELQS